MKIIKLFLLLTFGLWAEFKLDISKDIQVSQLESIVKNGWNDSNKTLNRLIVSEAERLMPEILKKIKKPVLKGVATKDDPFPVARLLLAKDDYVFILSYVKFLESMEKLTKAKELYIHLFEGMHNIEDKSFIAIIFYTVNEKMVTNSLLDGINKYHYSPVLKNELEKKVG